MMQEEGTDLKVCMSPHGHDYTGIGNHTNVLGINPVRIYDQASWASECLTHITQQLDFFKSVQVLHIRNLPCGIGAKADSG
jgi:hypothetical protein